MESDRKAAASKSVQSLVNIEEMTKQELLSIAQASKLLAVHPRTLREWANRGHVAHVKTPGGQRRFLRDELERFVQRMGERAGGQNLAQAAITGDPVSLPARRSGLPVHRRLDRFFSEVSMATVLAVESNH